jgi:hypothetical protein
MHTSHIPSYCCVRIWVGDDVSDYIFVSKKIDVVVNDELLSWDAAVHLLYSDAKIMVCIPISQSIFASNRHRRGKYLMN